MDAIEHVGILPTPELMQNVGLDIMEADRDARVKALDEGRSLNLSVKDIQKYHHTVFLKHTHDQIGERGWTAELPLRRYVTEARRTGDWTEADRQWRQLLESDPRSLFNLGALDLGFDSNWDAVTSAGLLPVSDWMARIYGQDRAGDLLKEPIPENDLGDYAHWAYRTGMSALKYQFAADQSVSNRSLTLIDGYTWDEERQAWVMFKRPLPNFATSPKNVSGKLGAGVKPLYPEFLLIEASPEMTETLNRKRQNRQDWFHQKRPNFGNIPVPATLALVEPVPGVPNGPTSSAHSEGAFSKSSPYPSLPALEIPALSTGEQIGIDLAFSPSLTLVTEAGGPQRIERPPAPAPDDAPVTLKQLQDSQEALFLDLRVTMMNQPAPEIDILALRKQLKREDYLDVLSGRTIHSYP
ncbi:hypothetical protein [Elstera cyanobacteriorum]|nr:hypothetical protein [Elstera cyanobacteriorum]